MHFSNLVKKIKIKLSLLLMIMICFVCVALTACGTGNNMKYNDAIAIAKKEFGCEKILWIVDSAMLYKGEYEIIEYRSNLIYYVVGEKDGEEIYITVLSNIKQEKPFVTTWNLDYSFTQIVEKFNEYGANYVADVPDDYYSLGHDKYIDLLYGIDLNGLASYYDVGGDDDVFYERLDVKVVFEYSWKIGETKHSCIITQENGELKVYKKETK